MHQINIKIQEKRYHEELASEWNELSPRDFKRIFRILFTAVHSGHLRVDLLKKLLFQNYRWLKRSTLNAKLCNFAKTEVLWELSECLSFLWKEAFSQAFIPKFSYRLTTYHLPGDNFRNGSLIEYIFADALLQHVIADDKVDEDILNELVAVLCRPAKPFWFIRKRVSEWNDGDPREKFNSSLIEKRKKKLSRLPIHYKIYVLRYFVGCKLHILETYEELFPKPKEGAKASATSGSTWIELLKDIADTKLYGNYDETAYYNLHTILTNALNDQRRKKK